MGRFRHDATGVKVETDFKAAPEGIYTLVILEASTEKDGMERITKNGDRYVSVKCEIDEGEFIGNKVWTNITFLPKDKKGAGMAVHFLKTIGEPWEGEFEVDTENWIGRRFKAKLVVAKDQKGRPKNEIAFIIGDEKETDEVPF